MPADTILVVTGVVAAFIAFSAVLAFASATSSK